MKLLFILTLMLHLNACFASETMARLHEMELNHPAYPDAVTELQTQMLKEKKWENVLGIAQVYRENFASEESTFRVNPFLMEAYALTQYCRFDDAGSILKLAEFYANKYGRSEDLAKIKKAQELEALSKLYKNLTPVKASAPSFIKNQIQWSVRPENKEVFKVLDQVVIRPRSLCQS